MVRNPGPYLDQLPSPESFDPCTYDVKQSDLEIRYNDDLCCINTQALVVGETRAHTESFLLIRMNSGPGLRYAAVTNGSTVQNAAQKVERQRMMRVIPLVRGI